MIRKPLKWSEVFGQCSPTIQHALSDSSPVSVRPNANHGWYEIGGKRNYFKSKWERRYALFLELLKTHQKILDWEYEPKTFWFEGIKRGCVSYKPDFCVTNLDKSIYWVEVKGYMDPPSKTKIKRFHKYFPDEVLVIIDKNWFTCNTPKMKGLIKEWD